MSTPDPDTLTTLKVDMQHLGESLERLQKWAEDAAATKTLLERTMGKRLTLEGTPAPTSMLELVQQVIGWAQNLDRERLHNLSKWKGMIGCGLSVDQPELLIFIDGALESIPKLQNALAYLINNAGNSRSPEALGRIIEAQDLVPDSYLNDPKNAREGDTPTPPSLTLTITDRDRTAWVGGIEEHFQSLRCETCGHDFLSNTPKTRYCPACGVKFTEVKDVSI